MADEERQPTQEELVELLQQEFSRLKVADVLAQTVVTVSQLGFMRMSGEDRDLEQARLAIESLRALVPVLKSALPEQAGRDFESVVANLQLAYGRAVAELAAPAAEAPSEEPPPEEPPAETAEEPPAEDAPPDGSPADSPEAS